MKYRSDFVTNSSSSSFIVSFNNKKDMESKMQDLNNVTPENASRVYFDILANRKTYTEVLEYLKERLKWVARYIIIYETPKYYNKPYEWRNSEECQRLIKEYIEKEIQRFKDNVNHRGIFSIVTYDDHCDGELEHQIMPYMPFTYKTISNH